VLALKSAFSTPTCAPNCVEEIDFTYDTSALNDYLDPFFSRFNLPEKTGDKVHYFVIRKNAGGKATLQYKLRRYSEALYPRKFQLGDDFESQTEGTGQVVNSQPHKDMFTKEKLCNWSYTVRFKTSTGGEFDQTFQLPANECSMLVFPENDELPPLPVDFPFAEFAGTVAESLGDQKRGKQSTLERLVMHKLQNIGTTSRTFNAQRACSGPHRRPMCRSR
jgi:hypothetical protein